PYSASFPTRRSSDLTYVSVDCVVFGFNHENRLNVLLVQRRIDEEVIERPKKLPGSLILNNEDVDDAAERVLFELTGIKKMVLKRSEEHTSELQSREN